MISYFLKDYPLVVQHASAYMLRYGRLNISIISYFEVLRGLLYRGKMIELERFQSLIRLHRVLLFDEEASAIASGIYVDLRRRGLLINDADLMIASIAMSNGLVWVTNNTAHYERISGLKLENWLMGGERSG